MIQFDFRIFFKGVETNHQPETTIDEWKGMFNGPKLLQDNSELGPCCASGRAGAFCPKVGVDCFGKIFFPAIQNPEK